MSLNVADIDFIMKGILPTSEWNITNGKLSREIETIFQTFGIDLKTILESICIKSNLYNDFQYKIEIRTNSLKTNTPNCARLESKCAKANVPITIYRWVAKICAK